MAAAEVPLDRKERPHGIRVSQTKGGVRNGGIGLLARCPSELVGGLCVVEHFPGPLPTIISCLRE